MRISVKIPLVRYETEDGRHTCALGEGEACVFCMPQYMGSECSCGFSEKPEGRFMPLKRENGLLIPKDDCPFVKQKESEKRLPINKGPWSVGVSKENRQFRLFSDDFTQDEMLTMTGTYENSTQQMHAALEIIGKLNDSGGKRNPVDHDLVLNKGPWVVTEEDRKVSIESQDGIFNEKLRLTGDYESLEQKQKAAQELADKLNGVNFY